MTFVFLYNFYSKRFLRKKGFSGLFKEFAFGESVLGL